VGAGLPAKQAAPSAPVQGRAYDHGGLRLPDTLDEALARVCGIQAHRAVQLPAGDQRLGA